MVRRDILYSYKSLSFLTIIQVLIFVPFTYEDTNMLHLLTYIIANSQVPSSLPEHLSVCDSVHR
jgi:hypothetical protein